MHIEDLLLETKVALRENTSYLKEVLAALKAQSPGSVVDRAAPSKSDAEALKDARANIVAQREAPPALVYKDVRDAIVKIPRQKAIDLLASFGVEKISELKEEQWAEAYSEATGSLSGPELAQ